MFYLTLQLADWILLLYTLLESRPRTGTPSIKASSINVHSRQSRLPAGKHVAHGAGCKLRLQVLTIDCPLRNGSNSARPTCTLGQETGLCRKDLMQRLLRAYHLAIKRAVACFLHFCTPQLIHLLVDSVTQNKALDVSITVLTCHAFRHSSS
jgi:hypothetical protein